MKFNFYTWGRACSEAWKKVIGTDEEKEEEKLSSEVLNKCSMFQATALNWTIDDVRSLQFTEGKEIKSLIGQSMLIEAMLGKVQSESDLDRVIPSRSANKRKIASTKTKHRLHLAQPDQQPLPAICRWFHSWNVQAKKKRYTAVMAFETKHVTKGLDVYCLNFCKWDWHHDNDITS